MKIVMTLVVKNEADVIQSNIEFHRSQGVDFFIVTDNHSEDGTTEILEQYAQAGILEYIYEADSFTQSAWVTRMARMAYEKHRADWVINNDADEFWWPLKGNLKTVLSRVPPLWNIVRGQRHNFVPLEEASEQPFHQRMVFRQTCSLNLLGRPLPPKVCHRGHPNVTVWSGNHRVDGVRSLTIWNGALEIFHFQIRSYEQFERRTKEMGAALEANRAIGPGVGRCRKELYEVYKEGRLPEYHRQRVYSAARVVEELAGGALIEDRRLAEHMQSLTQMGCGEKTTQKPSARHSVQRETINALVLGLVKR